ncbi:MAG TPA: radical SAM protein [Desulfobacteraceae bacterium]|nr:radical SAM protein [Desulfobacteraceae bacterium]
MQAFEEKLAEARESSWAVHGRRITFYLPGIFLCDGVRGLYPAMSITGTRCALNCDHCRRSLLTTMIPAEDPATLVEKCLRLKARGALGVLVSGGCDAEGRLPWEEFLPAVEDVKKTTGLYVSVHSGIVDEETARGLAEAGVDQALIDVVGDDGTYHRICHVPFGVERIMLAMQHLKDAGIALAPHIVCGLDYGNIRGEEEAVHMVSTLRPEQVVIVSYMKIPGTDCERFKLPSAEEVAEVIVNARLSMPNARINLGCARERGNSRIEELAVDAGVNRMALPSEEAVARARYYGLEIRYQRTCCSVSRDFSSKVWIEK